MSWAVVFSALGRDFLHFTRFGLFVLYHIVDRNARVWRGGGLGGGGLGGVRLSIISIALNIDAKP